MQQTLRATLISLVSFTSATAALAFKREPAQGWPEAETFRGRERPDVVGVIENAEQAHRLLDQTAKRDMGEPLATDRDLLDELGQVYTDPGDIPQLQVDVDGDKLDLPLEHTHVKAELTGNTARVEVTQTYQNPFTYPIEAIYVFPLPENSAVDDMKMIIGDRVIRAEIKRRREARETYEAAKREGYTAALLEQERPNVFTQSVANIEPGTDIDVVIRYLQNLTYDAGQYEFVFPMVVGPRFFPGNPTGTKSGTGWGVDTDAVPDASRISPPVLGGGMRSGHDISLELVATAGVAIKAYDVPTHDVDYLPTYDGSLALQLSEKDSLPNRDFVLRYSVDGKEPRATVLTHKGDGGGFLSLIVQPPQLDVDELVGNREIIFVVDVSGSMHGVPLSMCQDAMQEAIRKLRPVDTFNVITFSGRTAKAFPSVRPANETNIKQAMQTIAGLRAGGGTYMLDAINEALGTEVGAGRHRYVFFLTDGYVGNEKQIFDGAATLVERLERRGQRAKVFGFGVGSSTNRHLLDGLSRAGKGIAVYATTREDPTIAVNRFYRIIDHSILRDVEIDWGGLDVDQVFPTHIPDLFASRPLVLHARFGGAGSGTVLVKGTSNGKKIELPVNVTLPAKEARNSALSTLWARSKIGWLEQDLWAGNASQAIEEITELGLTFRIVTQYTSFVAVDRSKRVGGESRTIVQPVETPEGVDARMAGAQIYGSAAKMGRRAVISQPPGAPSFLGAADSSASAPVAVAEAMRQPAPPPSRPRAGVAARPKARVEASKKDTSSPTSSAIMRLIRAKSREIQACYERSDAKRKGKGGRLVVRMFITSRGVAIQVKVIESALDDEKLERCIVERIKKWRFPAHGGRAVRVEFPFVFSNGQ